MQKRPATAALLTIAPEEEESAEPPIRVEAGVVNAVLHTSALVRANSQVEAEHAVRPMIVRGGEESVVLHTTAQAAEVNVGQPINVPEADKWRITTAS